MARRGDAPKQSEITEKVEKHENDMHEKTEDVEKTVEDVETVRQTLEELDFGGTAEGGEAVEQSIEGAENVSVGEFDSESSALEELEHESEEHEGELQERNDTTTADLGKISDASGRIHSDAANSELIAAKESALRDIEFLSDQAQRAQEAREETQHIHDEHLGRVNTGRST